MYAQYVHQTASHEQPSRISHLVLIIFRMAMDDVNACGSVRLAAMLLPPAGAPGFCASRMSSETLRWELRRMLRAGEAWALVGVLSVAWEGEAGDRSRVRLALRLLMLSGCRKSFPSASLISLEDVFWSFRGAISTPTLDGSRNNSRA